MSSECKLDRSGKKTFSKKWAPCPVSLRPSVRNINRVQHNRFDSEFLYSTVCPFSWNIGSGSDA